MLTKHPSSSETLDEKYLTDIDLSIFGSDHLFLLFLTKLEEINFEAFSSKGKFLSS
jgi:hypothetical protein